MAIHQLVNNFFSLLRKIVGSFYSVSTSLTACVRQHNFIIEQEGLFVNAEFTFEVEGLNNMQMALNTGASFGMCYLNAMPTMFQDIPVLSCTREAIVDYLQEHEICRQLPTIEMRKQELERERV